MCGIVGYIGPRKVVPVIIEGLRKLEYRGYDSAGIAVVTQDGKMEIRRAPGKLRNLEEVIAAGAQRVDQSHERAVDPLAVVRDVGLVGTSVAREVGCDDVEARGAERTELMAPRVRDLWKAV